VGSLRAAEHIAKKKDGVLAMPVYPLPILRFGCSNVVKLKEEMQTEMSRVADFYRSTDGMKALLDKVDRHARIGVYRLQAQSKSGKAEKHTHTDKRRSLQASACITHARSRAVVRAAVGKKETGDK